MLNKEQTEYIDSLRVTNPGLPDATLRPLFIEAGWPEEEITEGLSRYKSVAPVAPPPLPPTPPVTQEQTMTEQPVTAPVQQFTPAHASPAHLTNTPTPAQASPARLTTVVGPSSSQTTQGVIREKSSLKKISLFVLILLLVGGASAGAYYYAIQNGLIRNAPLLTDDTIFKTTFDKIREINSARYGVEVSVEVNPKDAGAQSYEELYPISDEVKAQYKRDQDRLRDLVAIKRELDNVRFNEDILSKGLFPSVLPDSVNILDPQGNPYVYTPALDLVSYSLSTTFETQDAATAVAKDINPFGDTHSGTISGKTVTITDRDYISESSFEGKPTAPSLFGYLDLSQIESYIPSDFKANIHVNGTVDKTSEKPLNAAFGLGADVYFGDAMFAFDLETIKKENDYYAIVNKMPSFFSSYSKFKGTWFHVTEEDIKNYGYGEYMGSILASDADGDTKEALKKAGEQFEILLKAADTHKIATIVGKPEKVKDKDSKTLTKYTLQIASGNILPFYEDVTSQLATYEDPIMEKDEATVEFLKSEDAQKMLEFVKQNVTLNLYYDTKGFPAKLEINFRYIPSPEATTLKDKQVNLVFTLWFADINKTVEVTAPEQSTPVDELLTELFGMTKEELILNRQSENVSGIQNALEDYRVWTGKYPQSLDDLKTTHADTPQTTNASSSFGFGSSYLMDRPFLDPIPSDIFTKTAFGYKSTDSTYELQYTIKLPVFSTAKRPSSLYSYANAGFRGSYAFYASDLDSETPQVRTLKFSEGTNRATENHFSEANTDTKDSDDDLLSDSLEAYIGTDAMKTDTDTDGVSDSDELTTGSNPLGTGRIGSSDSDIPF
jgi:type II secretory pathway pseudopilin PulG